MTTKPFRTRCRVLFAVAVCCLTPAWANASPMYNITGLGVMPGNTQSIATGINSQGQVVGVSYTTHDVINGYDAGAKSFLYSGGQVNQINPLGGPANAINDSGQVVGGFYLGINNAGQYIGIDNNGVENVYTNGQATALPLVALAINNAGAIVGDVLTNGAHNSLATMYANGQTTDLSQATGLQNSAAVGINNNGDVLITGSNGNGVHSFLYVNHIMTDLTGLPGGAGKIATALNDSDQIVGNNFLYTGGQILPLTNFLLPNSGWSNLYATGINNKGQIIGQGLFNGQEEAFLMTPITQTVPEPTSVTLFGGVMAGLAFVRAKKRRSQ